MTHTLPAGTYYIGDPCYAFDQSWGQILDDNNYLDDGTSTIDGYEIMTGSTAYGDGVYKDNEKYIYHVDAGLLGIMPVDLLLKDNKLTIEEINNEKGLGRIVKFDVPVIVHILNGIFKFNGIKINTQ